MKKNDFLLLLGILAVAGTCWMLYVILGARGAGVVKVTVDGEVFGTYSLYEEREVQIYDGNVLRIHDGAAMMQTADCPDQICVKHQCILKNKETIVCLPNKVIVEIVGGKSDELDAVAK